MKKLVATTAILALMAVPMTAQAKHKKGMKGPPNAAGHASNKEDGGGASTGKMKGPPNADGYKKQ